MSSSGYGIGLVNRRTNTGDVYVYTFNAHGDVVGLVNAANGKYAKQYDYDAFGNEKGISQSDTNPFRYCGEWWDAQTKRLYLRARDYDSATGRFTREDPARDGLNYYAYCYNNPVSFVDPGGMKPYSYRIGENYTLVVSERWRDTLEEAAGAIVPLFSQLFPLALWIGSGFDIVSINYKFFNLDNGLYVASFFSEGKIFDLFDVLGKVETFFSILMFYFDTDYRVEEAIFNHIASDLENNGYFAFLSKSHDEVKEKYKFAYTWMKIAVEAGHIDVIENDNGKLFFNIENDSYKNYINYLIYLLLNWETTRDDPYIMKLMEAMMKNIINRNPVRPAGYGPSGWYDYENGIWYSN